MRIGDGLPQVTGIYTNDKKVSRVENLNNVQGIKDNVKISEVGKDYAIAQKALKDIPDVRQDKIEDVKAKMEKGDYANVKSEDIADKIIGGIL
ncbi:MAG: flagellar biosynthesis anti-sigma factor FlgM [Clostridiales bacterium]|nr:flagellar biosynthesis anti-sigma factor FlgM [Clostridiales bacterium]